MKVLLIALGIYSRTGGMEAFNRRVIRCLGECSDNLTSDLHVTCLWDEPEDAETVLRQGCFFGGSSSKLRTAMHFLSRVRMMKPDVVLYGHVMLTPLAFAVRCLSPSPRQLLFVHGTEVWGDRAYRRVPLLEIAAVRSCVDLVVSVSAFTAKRMARTFRLPARRFVILPNAVDLANVPERDVPGEPHRSGRTLLTVSRLGAADRYKGIDRVIRAMPEILKAVPQARYRVVGHGPLRAELEQLAARTGVADKVEFLGHVDDAQLNRCYSSADVMVLPSTGEGFGIVFLEAWRHRMPVICGDVDASSEVVTNFVNGLTVDPHDIRQIAGAAIRLLSDRTLARRLGDCGHETVTTRYTHAAFSARLAGILAEQSSGGDGRCAF